MTRDRRSANPTRARRWLRTMRARDPREAHRAATPLELLFDLCFVVAVAQAAAQLHHHVTEAHLGVGLLGYAMVFFTIWWAWMNFTWFASAYDTDDVAYRLLTLLQMAGALVLAAGVPAAATSYDLTVITIGYVVMRVALVAQWLRVARQDATGRPAGIRYAVGIMVVQAGWLVRLALPHPWDYTGLAVLVIAELLVPMWAEFRGTATSWHPGHISERYGLFTIIVLGEVIFASLTSIQSALSEHGVSGQMLLIAAGGLILVFTMWWIYFMGPDAALSTPRIALLWGYAHYLLFAAVAALGAGLQVAVDVAVHRAHVAATTATFAVAVPLAGFLLVMCWLRRLTHTGLAHPSLMVTGAVIVLVLALATPVLGVGGVILSIGIAAAATLTAALVATHRDGVPHPPPEAR
ncbi:low temperature requirement protein A [Nonomuraea rubra]|uniref:Low temperature requirement protein LtrA n=2 Tax=Nonomuraea rubra TaxID=46180 RepID=A0A7X0NXL7_9ACTN|nr:low temperature requirement protein A [Nonomuraea rubra]MBB6551241.1 low temperature requirement protein LtrA [Nonomuraea rubra]